MILWVTTSIVKKWKRGSRHENALHVRISCASYRWIPLRRESRCKMYFLLWAVVTKSESHRFQLICVAGLIWCGSWGHDHLWACWDLTLLQGQGCRRRDQGSRNLEHYLLESAGVTLDGCWGNRWAVDGLELDAPWGFFDSEILLWPHLCTIHHYTLPYSSLLLGVGVLIPRATRYCIKNGSSDYLSHRMTFWLDMQQTAISIIIYTMRTTNCRYLVFPPPHPSSYGSCPEIRKTVGFNFTRQVQKHARNLFASKYWYIPWNFGAAALILQNEWLQALRRAGAQKTANECLLDKWITSWVFVLVTRQHYSSSGLLQRLLRIPPSLPWNQSSCWSNASSYSHGHWQLRLCRSSTQLSKSSKTRLFRLLDVGFYFHTIMAIPGGWLRQAVKQTNKQSPN